MKAGMLLILMGVELAVFGWRTLLKYGGDEYWGWGMRSTTVSQLQLAIGEVLVVGGAFHLWRLYHEGRLRS